MLIIFVILQISMDFLLNENVLFSDLEYENPPVLYERVSRVDKG